MYALKTYRLRRYDGSLEVTLFRRDKREGRSEFGSWYEIAIDGDVFFKSIKTTLWVADKLKKLTENIERRRAARRAARIERRKNP